ncbi:MAG TPA: hypothetical protein VG963_23655, partial [Polyangiaceae bacterium]|nr:hypothetical protein [Polyangiaceae bacterium]
YALTQRARESVRRALRLALRPGVQARALGWLAIGHALVFAAAWGAAALPQGTLGFAITVPLMQSALLGRLFARSVWLATATQLAQADRTPHARSAEAH